MRTITEAALDQIWEAIRAELQACGDVDIKAGLAWIEQSGTRKIAEAALNAVRDLED